jgi:hypothetical protein
MAKIADATFKGETSSYSFEVYPADTTFNAVAAVYCAATISVASWWRRCIEQGTLLA